MVGNLSSVQSQKNASENNSSNSANYHHTGSHTGLKLDNIFTSSQDHGGVTAEGLSRLAGEEASGEMRAGVSNPEQPWLSCLGLM